MRRISFTKRNRSGNILHIETDMGIINIHVGLTDMDGRPGEHISVSCDFGVDFAPGEVFIDGSKPLGPKAGMGMRLIGPKEES